MSDEALDKLIKSCDAFIAADDDDIEIFSTWTKNLLARKLFSEIIGIADRLIPGLRNLLIQERLYSSAWSIDLPAWTTGDLGKLSGGSAKSYIHDIKKIATEFSNASSPEVAVCHLRIASLEAAVKEGLRTIEWFEAIVKADYDARGVALRKMYLNNVLGHKK